jgi:hypothetical protein
MMKAILNWRPPKLQLALVPFLRLVLDYFKFIALDPLIEYLFGV